MLGEIIIYLVIIIAIVATVIIVYYISKTPKALRGKERQINENPFIKEYRELENDEQKEAVLNFKLKCQKNDLGNISLKNIIAYYKKVKDFDILFANLLKSKASEFNLNFGDLFKIHEEKFDINEFVEVYIDFANCGLTVPLSNYIIHLQKGCNGRKFADSLIKSKKAGVELDSNDIIKNNLDDLQAEKIVHALIRAKKANIFLTEDERLNLNLTLESDFKESFKITKSKVLELHKAGKDIDIVVNAMIRAHDAGIEIFLDALDIYTLNDKDFEALINNLKKAKKAGIIIDQEDLLHQNISGNDISKLVNAMLIVKKNSLDIEFSELIEYHIMTAGDILKFVSAQVVAKINNLELSKQYFIDMTVPNGDLIDLVNSIRIIKKFSQFNIHREDVEKHYKKKGKVFQVIKLTIESQAQGLNLTFDTACEIDASEAYKLEQVIEMALHPLTLEVEPSQTVVTKEGIQITPKIRITWKAKIDALGGYKEDVVFSRISDALINEIETYKNHNDVLENLTVIAKNVFNKIKGKIEIPKDADKITAKKIEEINKIEAEIDENSAYDILDLTIYDIEIGKDIKVDIEAELFKIKNHHDELHAQIKMLEAEAELRLAMAEAYKNGEIPNFNEMHKDNMLKEKKKISNH